MPRGRQDLFGSVRRQAQRVLAALANEIRKREIDLERLRAQANLWRHAIGGGGARRGPGRPARGMAPARRARGAARRRGGARRVDWTEVLASVPDKFGVADVLKHPGARAKGRPQVYPALSRWMDAKKIKNIGKGKYQKL
jgi:hypothetical protein